VSEKKRATTLAPKCHVNGIETVWKIANDEDSDWSISFSHPNWNGSRTTKVVTSALIHTGWVSREIFLATKDYISWLCGRLFLMNWVIWVQVKIPMCQDVFTDISGYCS
jgi:hypothetical protein